MADAYREVQLAELNRCANQLSEHFDSVLVLCSSGGGEPQWFGAPRGNTFASYEVARRFLSGGLVSYGGGDADPEYTHHD